MSDEIDELNTSASPGTSTASATDAKSKAALLYDVTNFYKSAFKQGGETLVDHGYSVEQADQGFKKTVEVFHNLEIPPAEAQRLHSILVKNTINPLDSETIEKNNVQIRKSLRERYGNEFQKVIDDANAYAKKVGISEALSRGAGSDPDFAIEFVEKVQSLKRNKGLNFSDPKKGERGVK